MAHDLLRVRTVFAGFVGGPGLMTNYFMDLGGGGSPHDQAVLAADRVKNSLDASTGLWPDFVTWNRDTQVDRITDETGLTISTETVPAWGFHGTGGANQGPSPTGLLVRWNTAAYLAGRLLRGHTYLVPIIAGQDSNGSPNSSQLGVAAAFAGSMLDAGLVPELQLAVWRRPRPATAVGPGRPAGPARAARIGDSSVVTGFVVPDKFTVLRSRRD